MFFSSVLSARNHIRRRLGRGYCGGTGSQVVFYVQQPESLECRVCEVCFDSVDDLLDHVSSHVVLPIPDAQHRAISDPSSCDIVSAGEMTSALTPWAQTRNPPSSECGVSKTVATSSDKFLMKGRQLFTKL